MSIEKLEILEELMSEILNVGEKDKINGDKREETPQKEGNKKEGRFTMLSISNVLLQSYTTIQILKRSLKEAYSFPIDHHRHSCRFN